MWELVCVVLDYVWWSSEERHRHPFLHLAAFLSFWGGVVALLTLLVFGVT